MAHKAVLVVPAEKRIEFVDISSDVHSFLDHAKRLIGVDEITCYRLVDEEYVWLDDNGLIRRPWGECSFWRFRLNPHHTIAGNGLIIGTNREGDNQSTAFTDLRQFASLVEWVDPHDVRVRAPSVTFYDPKTGEAKVDYISGTEEWSFHNQPK